MSNQVPIVPLQSPSLTDRLEHVRHDTFRTVWDNPEYEQAYVNFGMDAEDKVERITMKTISPIADFNWDFQGLLFSPVRAEK